MKRKVLFCGTPEFARQQLEILINDSEYDVVTVVSQPDRPSGRGHKLAPSPVKAFALSKNIPVLTPEQASEEAFIGELKKNRYDVCIVVAYGQILRRSFLELFPNKCVNLHASLLPRWRGAAPIQRAIMAGDKETGICLQVVVPKLDAGAVIGERRLVLDITDDAPTVYDKLAPLGGELLMDELKKFLDGKIAPKTQDETQVTYAHKIEKAESGIDWSQAASAIHNHVRGLAAGPHASTQFEGRRLKILKTLPAHGAGKPGQFIEAAGERLLVGCGEGALQLLVVQPESKKALTAGEFLRGYNVQAGGFFAAQ